MNEESTNQETVPYVSEYRGRNILNLPTGTDRPFRFGVHKAEAILKYLDDIRKFVEMERQDQA